MLVTIFDGYIDEPSLLGVPPYISPYIREVAGVCRELGIKYEYITIDQWRAGRRPKGNILVFIGGAVVPGKYLRTYPASKREVLEIAKNFKGLKILGGGLAKYRLLNDGFDYYAKRDVDSLLYDILTDNFQEHRYHTLNEWNRWLLSGGEIVKKHPDYPQPLIVEIETFRGCPRYISGGCSFCIEPLYGKPVFRDEEDIIKEVRTLANLGVRNFRIGGQTCIYSYKGYGVGEKEIVEPNVGAIEYLFKKLSKIKHDVLHVDNANPAVLANYPNKAERITEILVKYTTSGNVVSFGMESADLEVIKENNLNAMPEEVMEAIQIVNEIGSERGENGMPKLLPGLNFICGLRGERRETYALNFKFLQNVLERGYLLRRINIRKVASVRAKFRMKYEHECWKFRKEVREKIDRKMLEKIVPKGTVLKRVYLELRKGNYTFGRQIGTYPLIIVFPYSLEMGKFVDAKVVNYGGRSVTAVRYPIDLMKVRLDELVAIPGIGLKRAVAIIRERKNANLKKLIEKYPQIENYVLELK